MNDHSSFGSERIFRLNDLKETENPFTTSECLNKILKNASSPSNEKGQIIDSKYFSFKKHLTKKDSETMTIHATSKNENINKIKENNISEKLEFQMTKFTNMTNISLSPQLSILDYINVSDDKKQCNKNYIQDKTDTIKLIDADLNLQENPDQNCNFNENNILSSKRNNLNNLKEISNPNNLYESKKNLKLNEEYLDKNIKDKVTTELSNISNKEKINVSDKKEKKNSNNSYKITNENSNNKEVNFFFNNEYNKNLTSSKKGIKHREEDYCDYKVAKAKSKESFIDDLNSNYNNKFHNLIIIPEIGNDKISTVFFNSNDSQFRTNDFGTTMEILRENFESLGYKINFESQRNNANARISSSKVSDSSKIKKLVNNANEVFYNTDQKLFELKESKIKSPFTNKDNDNEPKTTIKQIKHRKLSKFDGNSVVDLKNEEAEEYEANQEIYKSRDSYQSEKLQVSKFIRQNGFSFASANTNTILQDPNPNSNIDKRVYDLERDKNAINIDNNKNFNFTLKKRISKFDDCLINDHQAEKDCCLPLTDNGKKNASERSNSNNNDFKDLNRNKKNNANNKKNNKFKKMNSLGNKFTKGKTELNVNTIDEENINSKNNLLDNFSRNSFDENENPSNYCKENLNIKSSSKSTFKTKACYNSNSQVKMNLDKDLAFDSEKSKNSRQINYKENNSSNLTLAFQLNNCNNYSNSNINNSQYNKITENQSANKDCSKSNLSNVNAEREIKRKKIQKSNSLVEFQLKTGLQTASNLDKKSFIINKNKNSNEKLTGFVNKFSHNINNSSNYINDSIKEFKNNTKLAHSSSLKNNIHNSNLPKDTNNTNNPSECSLKISLKDEKCVSSMYKKTARRQSHSPIKKSTEGKKISFFTLNLINNTEDAAGGDLKMKDIDKRNNSRENCFGKSKNKSSKTHLVNKNNYNNNDYINPNINNKINTKEFSCNLNNNNNFTTEFVLTTLNNEEFNTNTKNECNLTQSEENNSEVIQLANNAYEKKPKQMIFYNKNLNLNLNLNTINNIDNNIKINLNNNLLANSVSDLKDLKKQSDFNNIIPNNNNMINTFNINNNVNKNISSHKRTYSEALEHNSKKSEFGFNNNINKLLNSTNMLSNSRDFGDPSEKRNKIRELSLGKYMHVFTDVDNDKSGNVSYLSSRKNSRIVVDMHNQTDGDLSSYRFNKFSPHYSHVNKFNLQGCCFNPDEYLKNSNSNANGNNNSEINSINNANNINENLLERSNFVSNFSIQNNINTNNNNTNNNVQFSGNNFKSKNYTPNSFRNHHGQISSLVANDNKIKNIFS